MNMIQQVNIGFIHVVNHVKGSSQVGITPTDNEMTTRSKYVSSDDPWATNHICF